MPASYLKKKIDYVDDVAFKYYGIVNEDNVLVAYCYIGFFGGFALVSTLLGHKNFLNDGIMYLMMIEMNKIIFNVYKKKGYEFIVYDTFFGATDGLKKFKEKLGYRAYKVEWKWVG